MACLAVNHIPHASTGVGLIRQTIRGHTQIAANGLAPPSLQYHPTRPVARGNLANADYRRARQRFGERLARALLVDLYTVLDTEILVRARLAGLRNPDSGFEANVSGLGLQWQPYPWAYARCVELSAVRNCIVHNSQVWQEGQINRLRELRNFPYKLPDVGQTIEIEISHLFVYKSSVRQILNLYPWQRRGDA